MRKTQRDKNTDIKVSLSGVVVIILSIMCFLVGLEAIIAIVKFFAG